MFNVLQAAFSWLTLSAQRALMSFCAFDLTSAAEWRVCNVGGSHRLCHVGRLNAPCLHKGGKRGFTSRRCGLLFPGHQTCGCGAKTCQTSETFLSSNKTSVWIINVFFPLKNRFDAIYPLYMIYINRCPPPEAAEMAPLALEVSEQRGRS